MMKIVMLSILTPYKENYNGTSALPYHLLIHRPKGVDVTIYSFNNNELSKEKILETEKELGINIKLIPLPQWFLMVFSFHLLFIRLFLRYPIHNYLTVPNKIVDEIEKQKPNGIWIYGAELSRVVKQFDKFKCVHSLPDSEALYYHRMMGTRFVFNSSIKYWKCAFMYRKYRRMESEFLSSPNLCIHVVGEKDRDFIKDSNPSLDVKFIHHPHYEIYNNVSINQKRFHSPIRLLIAGQYNYYMKQDADSIIENLLQIDNGIRSRFSLTFLGKGWHGHFEKLKLFGWEVNHIPFVENYVQEISSYDIQISPISIGTGTKGKVLDAIANGLLVIGSWYALENILSTSIIYSNPCEIKDILKKIVENTPDFEEMAITGCREVRKYHSRRDNSNSLFELFN